ncbi:unnamed protein product, partial [Prorocentrum cordatum]
EGKTEDGMWHGPGRSDGAASVPTSAVGCPAGCPECSVAAGLLGACTSGEHLGRTALPSPCPL